VSQRARARGLPVLALAAMPSSIYFQHCGKCAANSRADELNLDAPMELLNLDSLHKRSLNRTVEAMNHGRFNTAKRDFFGDKAIERSNYSLPSRLFLDPYHVSDGNLLAENFLQNRFQRGGMTSLAGRSKQLAFDAERYGKDDTRARARSRYVEPEGGRFVPALKPACSRDKGPDPYGTHKHTTWQLANTGFTGGLGTVQKMAPKWNTFALSRPPVGQ